MHICVWFLWCFKYVTEIEDICMLHSKFPKIRWYEMHAINTCPDRKIQGCCMQ